jgi:hypothetical protein
MKRYLLLLFCGIAIFGSCTYDVDDELNPDCEIETVTYSRTIVPILSAQCMSCHRNSAALGGVRLEDYEDLKIWVDNGRLLGSIRHQPGFSRMPQGGPRLPACSIAQIEAWIAVGAPNN